MDPLGLVSENMATGAVASIDFGDDLPGDADGLYNINDTADQFGSIDLFPSEGAFAVGSATVDTTAACAPGENVVEAETFDVSGLWEMGSSDTDVSDAALTLWFLDRQSTWTFTPSGDAPSLTFNDGVLTAIDATFVFEWSIDDSDPMQDDPLWTGTLTFAGDTVSLQLNDVAEVNTGFNTVDSTIIVNLQGVVDVLATQ